MISAFGVTISGIGMFFVVVSVIGLLILPDFYSRIHAAGVVDSAGMVLVFVGLGVYCGLTTLFSLKLLVLTSLALVTNTTMCGVLASEAYRAGVSK